jgi:hypothetical protein
MNQNGNRKSNQEKGTHNLEAFDNQDEPMDLPELEENQYFDPFTREVDKLASEKVEQCAIESFSEKVEFQQDIFAKNTIRTSRIVARSIKAPFFEGAIVNRFTNHSKTTLERGDVVALSYSTMYCPGNTGEVTLILRTIALSEVHKVRLSGVVIGNDLKGHVGFDGIAPGESGFVCVGGLCPLVRVDSTRHLIEEGERLIVGPEMSALPERAKRQMPTQSVMLGIALAEAETGDSFIPALIQPGAI